MSRTEASFPSPRTVLAVFVLGACAAPEAEDLANRGEQLYFSTELTLSKANAYTCSTCHDTREAGEVIKPGATMAGATKRGSYWGEQEDSLLRSVNNCRRYFMAANEALAAESSDAIALYEFLNTLDSQGESNAVAFTVVRTISNLPRGDASSGEALFDRACANCHGAPHSGKGRLTLTAPILPEDTLAAHVSYSVRAQRLVFIEKARHGAFLGYGGTMPPFSLEVLSDEELSDILEALGVAGQ